MSSEAYLKARATFEAYAAMNDPYLPENPISALQAKLARWETANFGAQPLERSVLGAHEEVAELIDAVLGLASCTGRLNHATLKNLQGVRGFDNPDKCREAIGDAIADMLVFAMQVCTKQRIDLGALLIGTAEHVMTRSGATPAVKP